MAIGLGDHFMKTYRHIKAEHEAGHRTKGAFENALDGMRKKKTDAKDYSDRFREGERREREKIRKSEPERVRWTERNPEKTWGDESKQTAAEEEARERHRREQDERRCEYEKRLEHEHREKRRQEEDRKKDRSSPIPEIRVQPPTSGATPSRPLSPVAHDFALPVRPNYSPPPAPDEHDCQPTLAYPRGRAL
ncbi:hypothetical protein J4E91_011241 [Alternaria rosae]|nr:hypothetical protein J4E91_011241 [Alternaria rosae]